MTLANPRLPPRAQRGLTILEMLVVVAILAAVSFVAYTNFDGVIDDSKERVARAEMLEIARAIRQFKQDTGYYPKQGPFGLALSPYDGGIDPSALPPQAGASPAEQEAWFYSPANFWQLFECPKVTSANGHPEWLGCNGGGAQSWDPARGRGWRGPYLNRDSQSLVDLSSDLAPDGNGDPVETIGSTLVREVFGIADPFANDPVAVGSFDPHDNNLVDWRSVSRFCAGTDCEIVLGGIGGPFFAFDLDDPSAIRVVSMGANGDYGGVNATDPCRPGDKDDIVLCLD